MIKVHNLSLLPASARKPRSIAAIVKKTLGKKKGDVNVVILDRADMKRMNKRYLAHSHDTDVIAFNYDEPPALGDVYISAWAARKQAVDLGHPVLREVLTLAVHGSLHLLGYDDHRPKDRAKMFRRQDAILAGR
jgi:probable rRNA maturation factor